MIALPTPQSTTLALPSSCMQEIRVHVSRHSGGWISNSRVVPTVDPSLRRFWRFHPNDRTHPIGVSSVRTKASSHRSWFGTRSTTEARTHLGRREAKGKRIGAVSTGSGFLPPRPNRSSTEQASDTQSSPNVVGEIRTGTDVSRGGTCGLWRFVRDLRPVPMCVEFGHEVTCRRGEVSLREAPRRHVLYAIDSIARRVRHLFQWFRIYLAIPAEDIFPPPSQGADPRSYLSSATGVDRIVAPIDPSPICMHCRGLSPPLRAPSPSARVLRRGSSSLLNLSHVPPSPLPQLGGFPPGRSEDLSRSSSSLNPPFSNPSRSPPLPRSERSIFRRREGALATQLVARRVHFGRQRHGEARRLSASWKDEKLSTRGAREREGVLCELHACLGVQATARIAP